jgi:methionyl-tRNA formyltransferase
LASNLRLEKLQIVFLGTPDFAVPTLNALIAARDLKVVATITQPDRQSGRGQHLHAPPVKVVAKEHSIPIFQPEKLSKAADIIEHLKALAPDLMVMVAFGQILKPELLAIPKLGVINLHASLLPAYRGAAPINWAIINDDTISGITTMFTEAGLDTGPILLKEEITIGPDVNADELSKKMARQGAVLVIKTIEQLKTGQLVPIRQDDSKATYAPLLSKTMACINWSQPALAIHNFVRGLIPWPIAFTTFHAQPLKIWRTQLLSTIDIKDMAAVYPSAPPGTIVHANKHIFVACQKNTWLELKEVQPANKPRLGAYDWANGVRLQSGEIFEFQK